MKSNIFYDNALCLKNIKFFKHLFIGPLDYDSNFINNDLILNKNKTIINVFIDVIIFSIKSWLLVFPHILLSIYPRKKFIGNNLFVSPDFFYNKKKGYHDFWRNIHSFIDVSRVNFIYFSSFSKRFNFNSYGNCYKMDFCFTFTSFLKLLYDNFRYNIFIFFLFIKNINQKDLINIYDFIKLGYIDDFFLYLLNNDFISKINSSKIFFISEFQYWELGLTNSSSNKFFAYQHSGIRFKDGRLKINNLHKKNIKILVNYEIEKRFLKESYNIDSIITVNNIRNNFNTIYSNKLSSKFLFFGSTDLLLDKLIYLKLEDIIESIFYKPHPSLVFHDSVKYFNLLDKFCHEDYTPILHSYSGATLEMLVSKTPFFVIFRHDFKDTLIIVKDVIESNISNAVQISAKHSFLKITRFPSENNFFSTENNWEKLIQL
jgi:hypothetical protein